MISIQTKLSSSARQRCLKHVQWQRQRSNSLELNRLLEEKLSLHGLISFVQRSIGILSTSVTSANENLFTSRDPIRMVTVSFVEPESDIQQTLEFLPGLSASIPCLINAKYLGREQRFNIKVNDRMKSCSPFFLIDFRFEVSYLDGQFCLLPITDENIRTLSEDNSLRIDSKVTFSHQHWLRKFDKKEKNRRKF